MNAAPRYSFDALTRIIVKHSFVILSFVVIRHSIGFIVSDSTHEIPGMLSVPVTALQLTSSAHPRNS